MALEFLCQLLAAVVLAKRAEEVALISIVAEIDHTEPAAPERVISMEVTMAMMMIVVEWKVQ